MNTGINQNPEIKVLIVYSDFQLGAWCQCLFGSLQKQLEAPQPLRLLFWKFDVLRFRAIGELATGDIAEAQLIVMVSQEDDLPIYVKSCLQAGLKGWQAKTADSRVNILVLCQNQPNEIESFLRKTLGNNATNLHAHQRDFSADLGDLLPKLRELLRLPPLP